MGCDNVRLLPVSTQTLFAHKERLQVYDADRLYLVVRHGNTKDEGNNSDWVSALGVGQTKSVLWRWIKVGIK